MGVGRLKSVKPLVKALPPRVRPPVKYVDPFYRSPDWVAFAFAVKEMRGWRCEDCSKDCSQDKGDLIADHIKERKDGGADFDLNNTRNRCTACHNRKTAAARTARYTGQRRGVG